MTDANQHIPAPLAPKGGRPEGLLEVAKLPRFATIRSIGALILREMSTSYGRTPGGYIWAILEPTLAIVLLVAIFSLGFRSPPIGTNFAIYYASGVLPFYMFVITSTRIAQAINFSNQLLAYPRVTFLDAILARLILSVLTQALVTVLIYTVILTTMDTRTILDLPALVLSLTMAAAIGLGIGLLNCVLTSRYAIWHTIWSVATRPLGFLSGVIFLPSRVPQPYRDWLEWNPILHVTGQSRKGFYNSYDGDYVSPLYVFTFAIICAAFGLMFVRRYFRDNLER